jgi:hypothetical protein
VLRRKRSSMVGDAHVPPREPPGVAPPSNVTRPLLYVRPVENVVVAAEYRRPFAPTLRPPDESDERLNEPEMVEEPVAKKLFAPVKPMVVVVELYPVFTVNGNAADEIVIGDEPMIVP